MIVVLDSPISNSRAISSAFTQMGVSVKVSNDPSELVNAKGIVIPGIGSFGRLSDAFKEHDLDNHIKSALSNEKKFLGVCLGLQFMTLASDEAPGLKGLSFFDTSCRKLPRGTRVPHVGWNDVVIENQHPILRGIPETFQAYFSHSYYAPPLGKETIAVSSNGALFSSIIANSYAVGIQFHPERSQKMGLKLLKNFVDWL
jgi:imidazole glycerol-phosphate synthase subunit HisH